MGFSQPPLWQLCVLEYQTGKGSVSVRAFCASQSIFWSTKCNDKPLCLVIGPISWCPIFLYEEMETGDLISSLAEEYLGKKKTLDCIRSLAEYQVLLLQTLKKRVRLAMTALQPLLARTLWSLMTTVVFLLVLNTVLTNQHHSEGVS